MHLCATNIVKQPFKSKSVLAIASTDGRDTGASRSVCVLLLQLQAWVKIKLFIISSITFALFYF